MSELSTARLGNLFATPVLDHIWADGPELNASLRESILAHERVHAGTAMTNVGGWHSEPGGLQFCGAAGQRLIAHMHEMVGEATRRLHVQFARSGQPMDWSMSMWANINRKGDYNEMHTHAGATWSGVYYVDHGEADGTVPATALQLFDPNPARTNMFFPELSVSNVLFPPTPGLMVLFPSYLPHSVPPHRGSGTRISIAFNVRRDPFP